MAAISKIMIVFSFTGGKPTLPAGLPSHYYKGFVGCVKKIKIFRKKLDLLRHQGDNSNLQFCEASPSDNSASLENWWWLFHLATLSRISLPTLVWCLTNNGPKVLGLYNINQMHNSNVAITGEHFFPSINNTMKLIISNSKWLPTKSWDSYNFCYIFYCVFCCANSNFLSFLPNILLYLPPKYFWKTPYSGKKNLLLFYLEKWTDTKMLLQKWDLTKPKNGKNGTKFKPKLLKRHWKCPFKQNNCFQLHFFALY